jgi:hypothetical protein
MDDRPLVQFPVGVWQDIIDLIRKININIMLLKGRKQIRKTPEQRQYEEDIRNMMEKAQEHMWEAWKYMDQISSREYENEEDPFI